jgi:LacI family transcriptional regulator
VSNDDETKLQSATIYDVAHRAGVSMKTVSRVVNREANVRPATRERVLEALQALNYRPNVAARSLASKRSYLLALCLENLRGHYASLIQYGAFAACRDAGYNLLINLFEESRKHSPAEFQRFVKDTRADGVILAPPLSETPSILRILPTLGIPAVRITPMTRPRKSLSVGMDERRATRDITEHLVSLGHRRIAFIRGRIGHASTELRENGFRDAMAEHGLAIDPELIGQGTFDFDTTLPCARALLTLPKRPTAIVASNDHMAAAVCAAAHRLALKVPEDVSVVGFDDSSIAQTVWPTLTTVRQPVVTMATEAVHLLLGAINGGSESERRTLDYEIVVRESTAPPRH